MTVVALCQRHISFFSVIAVLWARASTLGVTAQWIWAKVSHSVVQKLEY